MEAEVEEKRRRRSSQEITALIEEYRQNWIHRGCERAGPRIATIILVIETCRPLQIRPRDYLGANLLGLADFPAKRVAKLAPLVWVQSFHATHRCAAGNASTDSGPPCAYA
jgi:hypothetical protein